MTASNKPCFVCGKRLVDALRRPITPVIRDHHGTPVSMHQVCAATYDADQALERQTARVTGPKARL